MRATGERGVLSVSWLVAVVATVGMLAAVLVFTENLARTAATLQVGVGGIQRASTVTDDALDAATALAPAPASLDAGVGEVQAVTAALERSIDTLSRIRADLRPLHDLFASLAVPATDASGSIAGAGESARQAVTAAGRNAARLEDVRTELRTLAPVLDETTARTARIERKLRVLRLSP